MLYLSQHMCFGVLVAFSTNENPGKPVQTRISLCYEFTQSMDEDKDSKQNLDQVQLDPSKVFNWPTQWHLCRWHAPINKLRRVQSSNQIHGQWI